MVKINVIHKVLEYVIVFSRKKMRMGVLLELWLDKNMGTGGHRDILKTLILTWVFLALPAQSRLREVF